MSNLKITVTKKDFMEKPQKERDWMLFEAINRIDKHGCSWARGRWKRLYAVGGTMGFAGGFSAVLAKMAFWK